MTWVLLRSTGVIALCLLTLSVVLGISGPAIRRPSLRLVSVSVHSAAAAAGVLLIAGHVVLAVLDSWVNVSVISLVVPFASEWQPFWIGLGALALDALAILMVTSAFRRRTPRSWWRLHVLAYPAWALAFAHAYGIGTDRTSGVMIAIATVSLAAVVGALVIRSRATGAPVGVPTGKTQQRAKELVG